MWAMSDRFNRTISQDHVVAVKAEIIQDDNTILYDLTEAGVFINGTVTVSDSQIQRTASVDILDPTGKLTPDDYKDLLTPVGNQIRLWRGIRYPDDTVEYCPIGVFRFTKAQGRWPLISLPELYDRAWLVDSAFFEYVRTYAKGTPYIEAIQDLLTSAYPGIIMDMDDSEEITNKMSVHTYERETSPWAVARELGNNLHRRLFFDPMGTCKLETLVDPTDPENVVWTFDDTDVANMRLTGSELNWDGSGYNSFTVISENSSLKTPIRAIARDLNVNSPTYYYGPYGKHPAPVLSDEKISSVAQAQARANKALRESIGITSSVTINSMIHPALEAHDLIRIVDSFAGIDIMCNAEDFAIPLHAKDPMTIATRIGTPLELG